MKALLKSAFVGLAGMGLFFCFFMLVSMAVLMLAGMRTPGLVISPTPWFRHAGLPLGAAAFVLSFAVGWKKFHTVHQ